MKISTEVFTSKVEECKVFYLTYFDFKVKSTAQGFVVLQHSVHPEYELMFCMPDSPFVNPIFHPEFNGKGIILQFEVEDVVKEYNRLKELQIEFVVDLISEPVNGHHFTIQDPSGLLIDIVAFDYGK